jgi:hypothetical protein
MELDFSYYGKNKLTVLENSVVRIVSGHKREEVTAG